MHFTNLAFTTLLATASAIAVPAINDVKILDKRSEKTWDEAGNIKLTFSRETVQIGTLTTDEIIGTVAPICHESGQCETNDLEMKAQLFSSESVKNLIITIGPDGEYPTWIRNGLLDTLGAAAKTVAKCTDGTYTNTCPGVSAMAYCPRKKTKFTNCEVPKYWGINYQHPSVGNAAPPNLGFNINVVEEGKEDLCENVMTGLGAVAGAVHGVAGGIFTLLTFACK
ncbi:hypothetical protein BKA66DRAFT_422058 [Pyrenochaeta sp. MPI-SDFR-AT-0127]|nr:hypothetical protein BKA66DRAFT_422058 [Pyrenochaeta sp. MPI-SDFR-AT-0127]